MRVSPDSFPSILPTDNQSRHYGLRVLGGSEEGTAATARGDNNDPLLAGSTDAVAGAGAGYSRGGGWADPPAHHSNNGNGDRGTAVSDIARSSLTRSSDENRGSSGAAMRQPGGERRSSSKEVSHIPRHFIHVTPFINHVYPVVVSLTGGSLRLYISW